MKLNYNKILNIVEYVFAFFLILECRSVFVHKVNVDYRIPEIVCICLFGLIVILLLEKKRNYNRFSVFFTYIFIFLIYITIFMICSVNKNEYVGFILRFFCFFIGILFYYILRGKEEACRSLMLKISNIMIALACISLLFYILGPILQLLQPTGKIKINWGIQKEIDTYYNIHYVAQRMEFLGNNVARNTGIFTESPMYSLNLTIALIVELFFVDKIKLKKIFILCFTILTTLSTTGAIVMMMALVGKYIITKFKSKFHIVVKKIALPIVCIIVCILAIFLLKTKAETTSFQIRMDDYRAGFLSWKDSPIIGNGYGNTEALEQYMSYFRAERTGQSNSILKILSEGGIYFFLFYFVPWIGCIIYSLKNRERDITIVALSMFVLFFVTIFPYNFTIINFVAMAWFYIFKNSKGVRKV